MEALTPQQVSAQATEHMAEYLEGGWDWETQDLEDAKPHGLEKPIAAAWQATKSNLPPWLIALNGLRDDFEDHWLPAALSIIAEGKASADAVAVAAEHAFEDGERHFREALATAKPKAEEGPTGASLRDRLNQISEQDRITVPAAPTAPVWEPCKLVTFGDLQAIPTANPASLDKKRPYDSAKEFVSRFFIKQGFLCLYFWQGNFWHWNGQCYAKLTEAKMRDMIYAFLDSSNIGKERFTPTDRDFREVLHALEAGLTLEAYPPLWLNSGNAAGNVLMFKNGLVDIITGNRRQPDPRLWIHGTLNYDWDPSATCPTWLGFLESIFPNDSEAQSCIEEQLGYCLTEDVRLEKAFMWVGPPRSGKGTIVSVLEALVGSASYISLSIHTWVSSENSQQKLLGKKVGCFPDVRLKPGKFYGRSYDAGGLDHKSVELLLRVIAGDTVSIKRMYDGVPWEGRLPMKIVWVANQPPNLNDEKALPSRFIKVAFGQSFLGKEDITLKDRLLTELPGIAVRCLTAYRRLVARGRFIQPASATQLEKSVVSNSDTFTEFVLTHFVPDKNGTVNKAFFRSKLASWATEKGYEDLLRLQPKDITRKLLEVPSFAEVGTFREHNSPREYTGIRFVRSEG